MSAAVVCLDRDAELSRLIRQQARDDRQRHAEPREREVLFCDLIDEDDGDQVLFRIEDHRTPSPELVAIEGEPQPGRRRPRFKFFHLAGMDTVWTAEVTAYDPARSPRCPGCGDTPDIGSHCVVCGRGPDTSRPWPMRSREPAPSRKKRALKGGKGRS